MPDRENIPIEDFHEDIIGKVIRGKNLKLTTLASALAESGDYDQATAVAEKAIAAARATGRHDLVAKLRAKIDRFRQGDPAQPE